MRFKQFFTENQETENIEVTHPGVEGLPEGAWNDWAVEKLVKHFISKAKSKGKKEIANSINNLVRWNKKHNPSLSEKASSVMNKLSKNNEWAEF